MRTVNHRLKGALFAMAVLGLVISLALPSSAHAGPGLVRLAAQNTAIDGKAILVPSTVVPADTGSLIEVYNNQLSVPMGNNVIYVTFSGEAIMNNSGDGVALNCTIDGANCLNGVGTPGTGSVSSIPAGWVIPLGSEFGGSIEGLTGLGFQWCAPITKGKHTVKINAASAFGSQNAWLEGVHVYVDVNSIPRPKDGGRGNACGSYATPNSADSPD